MLLFKLSSVTIGVSGGGHDYGALKVVDSSPGFVWKHDDYQINS